MTEGEDPGCRLCGKRRGEHAALEEQRVLNHLYSESGDLQKVDRSPKGQQQKKSRDEVMVLPGADLLLRKLLVEKGVLSASDFDNTGAFGWQSGQDREDRPAEGPE